MPVHRCLIAVALELFPQSAQKVARLSGRQRRVPPSQPGVVPAGHGGCNAKSRLAPLPIMKAIGCRFFDANSPHRLQALVCIALDRLMDKPPMRFELETIGVASVLMWCLDSIAKCPADSLQNAAMAMEVPVSLAAMQWN